VAHGIAASVEATGQWRFAIDTYLEALEVDDCAEKNYRRLMTITSPLAS
jgi:hypothetical protein